MADTRIKDLVQAAITAGDFLAVDPAGAGDTYKVPVVGTNGVIEYGSNANGEYIRFADGTQICWGEVITAFNDVLQLLRVWTFPAAFVSGPEVLATIRHDPNVTVYTNGGAGGIAYIGHVRFDAAVTTGTSTRIVVAHNSSGGDFVSGDQVAVAVQAIGRWK